MQNRNMNGAEIASEYSNLNSQCDCPPAKRTFNSTRAIKRARKNLNKLRNLNKADLTENIRKKIARIIIKFSYRDNCVDKLLIIVCETKQETIFFMFRPAEVFLYDIFITLMHSDNFREKPRNENKFNPERRWDEVKWVGGGNYCYNIPALSPCHWRIRPPQATASILSTTK